MGRPRKNKTGFDPQLATGGTADADFNAALSAPVRPPLPERLAAVVKEAVEDREAQGKAVPKGKATKNAKSGVASVTLDGAPSLEGPFTVSGCRTILTTFMGMLANWTKTPSLTGPERIDEGAKLHSEILNTYAPPSWKEKAPLVMLGAWWTGVGIDVTMSRLSNSNRNTQQDTDRTPPPGSVAAAPTPLPETPPPFVDLNRTRRPFKTDNPDQRISG